MILNLWSDGQEGPVKTYSLAEVCGSVLKIFINIACTCIYN